MKLDLSTAGGCGQAVKPQRKLHLELVEVKVVCQDLCLWHRIGVRIHPLGHALLVADSALVEGADGLV